MQKSTELVALLENTFQDQKIDSLEKATLFDTFKPLSEEQRAFVRNRAFDIAKQFSRKNQGEPPYKWLEQIIKCLDNSSPLASNSSVYFSPGEDCLSALLGIILGATQRLDICVFTISDNRLRDALLNADKRGVAIRIITDNDKTEDQGSDVEDLIRAGLAVRMDETRHHMHHKFAIADRKQLATGSFNWTRSASKFNHENILIMNDETVVVQFEQEFDRLWQEFA